MNRRTRGAAFVSLLWVVVLIVLLLIGGVVIYMFASERTALEGQLAVAQRDLATSTAKVSKANKRNLVLSGKVGFRDDKDPLSESRPEEIDGLLKQLSTDYGADTTTLFRMTERLRTRIDDVTRERDEARTAMTTSEQARASLQQNLQDMTRQKDEAHATLEKTLSDERDRNASQETAEKARNDDLNRRLTDLEGRSRSEKGELDTKITELEGEIKKREGRIVELSKRVEFIRLPDTPDGSIVQVSTAGTAYIDLGTRNLLRRGTRFKVFTYGKGGEMRDKGMIEVSKVEDTLAEATIVETKDKFDPITAGDRISAPNFDPKMPREFVLVGRFPTGYSRAMVADRLRSLGAKVADKVGPATDFLVLGDRETPAAAAEEGAEGGGEEGGEESAESEEMKLAALYRVQTLPVREILEYLKYE